MSAVDYNSAEKLADAIREVTANARSEEDIRIGVEKLLDPFLEKYGIRRSHYETATRVDAQHGNLFIEYKRPGKLARKGEQQKAIDQITDYLLREATQYGHQATAALRKMRGVCLDGESIMFVRYIGRRSAAAAAAAPRKRQPGLFPEAAVADFYASDLLPITPQSIETFLAYLRALSREQLTPEALAEAFGPKGKDSIAASIVTIFYKKLRNTKDRRVQTFFAEWQRIFGIVYGQDVGKAEADARAFAKLFGLKTAPRLKPFLFSIHTYFALLMKLLCAEIMSLQRGALTASFLSDLPSIPMREFGRRLRRLEDGGFYHDLGINNFLEGDFFVWYLAEWDRGMADALRAMVRRLSNFESATPYLAPETSRDLLKKLYQYLVPKKLRHDLGEYYTPDWLAEHLLNQLGYDGNIGKRLLDPACGSGTFLVLAIKRMRDWAAVQDVPVPDETLARKILDNFCGFDLNPIAVIAARTNFLLALGELARHVRPIEIPIYMCDSVLTPSEYGELFGKGYRIPTAVGDFEIPGEIVASDQMEKLAALLEQCARGDYSPREFLNCAKRELKVSQPATFEGLKILYEAIQKLEKQNRNGIWARWLKNAFAPLFKGKFHYVAGNPPWINWESLSDEYRIATRKLWDKYGLFSLKGHAARLGGGKKDFAMLFAYAGADSYLESGGKLGFVITQTVFKTRGAGDGFRRFQLGNGVPLKVLSADDMAKLKPFEGAANRTATVVLEKGKRTRYPVDYQLWRRTTGSIPSDARLDDAIASTQRLSLAAQPVETTKPTSPWITAPPRTIVASQKATGKSAYKAWAGSCTWLNGVYWVNMAERRPDGILTVENMGEVGKIKIPASKHPIEPDLLYPLLRGRDVKRWRAAPSTHIILAQDLETRTGYGESWMKTNLPNTFRYFKGFEDLLRKRSGYRKYFDPKKDAFYSMYNIGPYTLAPYKVVWREQAAEFTAAVVVSEQVATQQKPIVPDHKLMLVGLEDRAEAHYLCAALNSCVCRVLVKGYVVETQTSVHVLEHIAVPKFDSHNSVHKALAELSQHAHKLTASMTSNPADEEAKRKLEQVEEQIDRAAAKLWGLTDDELTEIYSTLELLR